MSIWYSVLENDNADERFEVDGIRLADGSDAVLKACVEDDMSMNGTGDCDYPLTYILYETEDGPEIGRYKVNVELVPKVTATMV